jgi:YD repeat-containing protein
MRLDVIVAALALAVGPVAGGVASAQETTTYAYDAKGRIVTVARSGGPSSGTTSTYSYDPADNRSNVTVTGSANGNGNGSGDGALAATTAFVVLPLNGYLVVGIPH